MKISSWNCIWASTCSISTRRIIRSACFRHVRNPWMHRTWRQEIKKHKAQTIEKEVQIQNKISVNNILLWNNQRTRLELLQHQNPWSSTNQPKIYVQKLYQTPSEYKITRIEIKSWHEILQQHIPQGVRGLI